ncbi:MAG TPA: asparagine synthase [Methanosarcinales archaeon]|nr:asparagine synthase [Methanosarcinales archaeon]
MHTKSDITNDETAAQEMITTTLSKSVKKYLTPDCAVLFSGGVDSSLIAALAARYVPDITLITIGFPGSNDVKWAPDAAQLLGVENSLILKMIDLDDVESTIPCVMEALETADPMTISLGVPLYIACTKAKSRNTDLLLAGQGADELFGGYHRYKEIAKEGASALHEAIAADVARLPRRDILRDNTVAEAAGIKLVAPFLDPAVVELALSIPAELKVREFGGELVGKYILRKAAENVVPAGIAWREKKAFQYGSGVWAAFGRLARQAGFKKQDKGYIRKYLYSVAKENRIKLDVTS